MHFFISHTEIGGELILVMIGWSVFVEGYSGLFYFYYQCFCVVVFFRKDEYNKQTSLFLYNFYVNS